MITVPSLKPGDAYDHLGTRIIIVKVTKDRVTYVCRIGDHSSPPRQSDATNFRWFLENGIDQGVVKPEP